MTPDEVVGFCNHLYGETSWFLEDKEWIYLFTLRSKWLIKKNDYKRFGFYTLFHFNETEGQNYHPQKQSHSLDFLIYEAICHDATKKEERYKFSDFLKAWDIFKYGQQLFENTQTFNFLAGEELSGN